MHSSWVEVHLHGFTIEVDYDYEPGAGAITRGGPDKWCPPDPSEIYIRETRFRGKTLSKKRSAVIWKAYSDLINDAIEEEEGNILP